MEVERTGPSAVFSFPYLSWFPGNWLTVCPGLTLKSESKSEWSTQKLKFQDQEVFISSTASAKGGICGVVAIVVPFHQTEGAEGTVQPGAQTKVPALVPAEGAAW